MERTVNINIDIKIARNMLGIAGFSKVAYQGSDEEVFNAVLDMISCYGATCTPAHENIPDTTINSNIYQQDEAAR